MNLFELTGVKRLHKYDEWKLEKILRRLGVKMIGAGKFGKVFAHANWDYVVKVFKDGYYLDFVNFVLAHPNKHFPHFKRKPLEMHQFHTRDKKLDGHKIWVVKIEKLKEITDEKLLKSLVENIPQMIYRDARTMAHKSENYGLLRPDGEYRRNYSYDDLIHDYPFFKTLNEAYTQFVSSDFATGSPDIHAGNFMQRDDGTIVIIDPQWEGSNPYKEYDAWYKRETDYWAYYEPEMTSGPRYQAHIDAEKKAKEEERQARMMGRLVAKSLDIDDDIPF